MADTIHTTNEEPATKHDTTEGGVIGAVGGAIVGGLAGGPVGAVIGAVVGGAASAAAVHQVDKHDHDYTGAEYQNSADLVDADADNVVTTNSTMAPASYATDTSYATTATPTTTDYAATTPAPVATAYASAATTNYADATAVRDTGDQVVVPVVEEELQVGKRVEETGGAHIHTTVVETPVQQSVNLREEHVTVERHAVDRAATAADFVPGAQDITLTESREVPVVAKEARVVEEVVVGKTASEHTETINDTVRRTDVVVDDLDSTTKTGSAY